MSETVLILPFLSDRFEGISLLLLSIDKRKQANKKTFEVTKKQFLASIQSIVFGSVPKGSKMKNMKAQRFVNFPPECRFPKALNGKQKKHFSAREFVWQGLETNTKLSSGFFSGPIYGIAEKNGGSERLFLTLSQ